MSLGGSGKAMPPGWFVGCGNMGGAMVAGWVRAGRDLSALTAISPSGREVPGVKVATEPPDAAPEWVWLGHKPYQVEDVASSLAPKVEGAVILSILGGVECASLRRLFPGARAIVRLMPNLPVSHGEGVTGLYSDDADETLRAEISDVIADLGLAPWGEQEDDITAISTVAGSGPAYVARFITALAKQAEALGLDAATAQAIALQTVAGTGLMARSTGEGMRGLAVRVASPGGSTQAGLDVLDAAGGVEELIARTVAAARRRTEEMAAEARG
ncbi:pyrroline-5-carboxylate reductase family protein [Sphingomicrobium astaxanthinifaciens]|uniref:pyrroline-5-carboxylate reductase family protein n=1 Tax=Sphingomicrobium astaxanthinifaciens TaxID=1227949 RepID=UPI001FCAA1BF|nr:pyrroline-5-carboxylate reductase dimerization domain-containing protein [Sphingomicrobium astaxanthinifaciens]MCJ7420457.1 NAD(P)-binding domain-containing protein [Sphingomicrobium astaxanthinifaciens]